MTSVDGMMVFGSGSTSTRDRSSDGNIDDYGWR